MSSKWGWLLVSYSTEDYKKVSQRYWNNGCQTHLAVAAAHISSILSWLNLFIKSTAGSVSLSSSDPHISSPATSLLFAICCLQIALICHLSAHEQIDTGRACLLHSYILILVHAQISHTVVKYLFNSWCLTRFFVSVRPVEYHAYLQVLRRAVVFPRDLSDHLQLEILSFIMLPFPLLEVSRNSEPGCAHLHVSIVAIPQWILIVDDVRPMEILFAEFPFPFSPVTLRLIWMVMGNAG